MAPLLDEKDGVKIIIHSREHLPPHIHAIYGEDEALINIRSSEMFEGYVPPKKLKIVQKWLGKDQNRKRTEKNFYELNPGLHPDKHRAEKKKAKTNKSSKKRK